MHKVKLPKARSNRMWIEIELVKSHHACFDPDITIGRAMQCMQLTTEPATYELPLRIRAFKLGKPW